MHSIALSFYIISGFVIFWAMVGYPIFMKLLRIFYSTRKLNKDYNYQPTVTVMVVAHNEEKVIEKKLKNLLEINYPNEKLNYIVASDHSTDKTNVIVKNFIKSHSQTNICLYEVKERKGKTNAQNEAQKIVNSEMLVMTDANSMLDKNSVMELVAAFADENISYVSGRLMYHNANVGVSEMESTYWDADTKLRNIESDIQTITAGNGALYACRNSEYHDFDPIKCHDSQMPRFYALKNKRALYNPDAIAYEKAGEILEDEFKRKVRMNRGILMDIMPDIRILNVFKYRWYTFFYIGHRTCRYLLWAAHLTLLISNIPLLQYGYMFLFVILFQITFFLLGGIQFKLQSDNRYLRLINYYCMTILAQWVGVYNIITGKTKPYWEKAESTR